jgi:diadenosine tetraphosphate (Ap4A) HIT family hydrolase
MSASPSTPGCPLCHPATHPVIWSDDRSYVIRVDDPDYPGFTRVIWRDHVAEMTDLSPADRAHVMAIVWEVEQTQRDVLVPDKVNLASFGNMVPHVHWHVIPRWRDDRHFPDPFWAPPRIVAGTESAAYVAHRELTVSLLPRYFTELVQRLNALHQI